MYLFSGVQKVSITDTDIIFL